MTGLEKSQLNRRLQIMIIILSYSLLMKVTAPTFKNFE